MLVSLIASVVLHLMQQDFSSFCMYMNWPVSDYGNCELQF